MTFGAWLYLFFVIFPGAFLALYLIVYYVKHVLLGMRFMKLAKKLGLNYVPQGMFTYPDLHGRVKGHGVFVGIKRKKKRMHLKIKVFFSDKKRSYPGTIIKPGSVPGSLSQPLREKLEEIEDFSALRIDDGVIYFTGNSLSYDYIRGSLVSLADAAGMLQRGKVFEKRKKTT